VAIDGQLAEAHTSLAMVRCQYDWRWADAESEFKQAIALNPNYPTAHHWYALMLSGRGRFDEAVSEIRRAQELDPVSLIINTDGAAILFQAGRYDQAIEQSQKTLELDPTFIQAHNILGLIYEQRKMYDQWIAEREKMLTLSGKTDQADALSHLYAESGYKGVLKERLAALKEQAKSQYVPAFAMAVAYANLEDNDRAFEWLDKAFEERSTRMADLDIVPALQRLHSDPRFAVLLRRVNSAQLD
jgi:tetratricopeptide (TPR) repeat protein